MLSRLLLSLLAAELTGYILLGIALHALLDVSLIWLVVLAAALAMLGRTSYVFWCYRLGGWLAHRPTLWADLPPHERFRVLAGEVVALTLTHSFWQPLLPLLRPLLPRGGRHAHGLPVLFVHGYCCNEGFWIPMRRRLARAGLDNQYGVSLEPLFGSIDTLADRLAERIEAVCRDAGQSRVIIVAHSMGGLVARACLQRHGGERLAHVITIGTPHSGTAIAGLGIGVNARQMRIGSEWLRRLSMPCDSVPFTAVYSAHDELIAPPENATLAGANNLALSGLGHIALSRAGTVGEIIRKVADIR